MIRILQTLWILLVSSTLLFAKVGDKKVLNPKLQAYSETVLKDFGSISKDRKLILKELAKYVKSKSKNKEKINLIFICTHNSRRSHMSQIWAQTASEYYGIKGVSSFSGGTEATAFNPRAVAALERAGFEIAKTSEDKNPAYEVKASSDLLISKAFSKKYSDDANPKSDFCAVMTCSQADKACPLVLGATKRISLPFEDPKAFDGTDKEAAAYDERCKQIATEMFYLFSLVK